MEALKGRNLGEVVLIPDVMLKEGEGLFLDEMTVGDLEKALETRVIVVESTPQGIHDALTDLSALPWNFVPGSR